MFRIDSFVVSLGGRRAKNRLLPFSAALLIAAAGSAVVRAEEGSSAPQAPAPGADAPDAASIEKALEADRAQAGGKPSGAGVAGAPAPSLGAAPSAGSQYADGAGPSLAEGSAQAAVRPAGAGLLNPNTSVILDGVFGYYGVRDTDFAQIGIPAAGDDPSPDRQGFNLQEIELAFQAPVDPYLEGSVFLTIPNLEGLEVEEAYLLTTSLPANLQFKAGSFRSQIGRNNGQHLHVQHFVRRPLMTPLLFGGDGFRGPGFQASLLIPGLPWYATLYGEAFSIGAPEAGVTTFGGGGRGPSQLTYTAVLEQFWAPTDATSVMLGLNAATGFASECAQPPCGGSSRRDYLYGADLFFKWRPPTVVGERTSVSWTLEYFARTLTDGGPTEGALYTESVLQVAKRWYLGGRFDLTGTPSGANIPRRYGIAASISFAPTEFSRLRLYGQDLWGPSAPNTLVGFVQAEYSIGAHGAHPF